MKIIIIIIKVKANCADGPRVCLKELVAQRNEERGCYSERTERTIFYSLMAGRDLKKKNNPTIIFA